MLPVGMESYHPTIRADIDIAFEYTPRSLVSDREVFDTQISLKVIH